MYLNKIMAGNSLKTGCSNIARKFTQETRELHGVRLLEINLEN